MTMTDLLWTCGPPIGLFAAIAALAYAALGLLSRKRRMTAPAIPTKTIKVVAGERLRAGDAVYIGTDGRAYRSSTGTPATSATP